MYGGQVDVVACSAEVKWRSLIDLDRKRAGLDTLWLVDEKLSQYKLVPSVQTIKATTAIGIISVVVALNSPGLAICGGRKAQTSI